MERHLAVAALVGAGLDVLHTDATAVFLRDPLPMLRAQPQQVDVLFQRDDWPASPVQAMGTAVNPSPNPKPNLDPDPNPNPGPGPRPDP